MIKKTPFDTVDEYISSFPEEVSQRLEEIRAIIKETAPDVVEGMGYGMPSYKLNKRQLIYYAGYEKHIGLYAMEIAHAKFAEELSSYKQGKGSVQFPHDRPFPLSLIRKMVEFRVNENLLKRK